MDDNEFSFEESRRANRIIWNRPVRIITPVQLPALILNVSAVGLLLNTHFDKSLVEGCDIEVVIPHATGKDIITVKGKIVRVKKFQDKLQVAIDIK
ncbi:MAG: hypothetical protein BGO78_07940 [Chloroflexi bacterium 44-23]|nr:MAG: hypothetical protein BGO78_07940 [Chloroflexi bacterium 44-23]